jgi:hypothetical protein
MRELRQSCDHSVWVCVRRCHYALAALWHFEKLRLNHVFTRIYSRHDLAPDRKLATLEKYYPPNTQATNISTFKPNMIG